MNEAALRWVRLLSRTRVGKSPDNSQSCEDRSDFDKDYDRIIYSSAFRRLQDKTQVFPLSRSDYIRTRLTHSLEVSCVGRSLGRLAGLQVSSIAKALEKMELQPEHVGTLVSAACLAHDIGNPPFGHCGEAAIQQWAKSYSLREKGLNEAERQDLEKFEGNAQSFRILTKLHRREPRGGLRPTFAMVGTLAKYPCPSLFAKESADNCSWKKFGYFQDDRDLFCEAFEGVGIKQIEEEAFPRHPSRVSVRSSRRHLLRHYRLGRFGQS